MLAQFTFTVWSAEYTVQVTGLGDRDEGVVSRMSVGFFTRRAETCQQVVRMLQQDGLVMVRGPPVAARPAYVNLWPLRPGTATFSSRCSSSILVPSAVLHHFRVSFRGVVESHLMRLHSKPQSLTEHCSLLMMPTKVMRCQRPCGAWPSVSLIILPPHIQS